MPVNMDNKEITAKKLECKLLDIISFNKYKLFISKKVIYSRYNEKLILVVWLIKDFGY